MTATNQDLPYRPCVGIFLFNDEGRVLVARRNDVEGEAWQMPQGGVDDGEDARTAALRELAEELGTDKVEVVAELDEPLRYDLPAPLVGAALKGRYRGQELRWVAMRFTGRDADIAVAEVAHPEFDAWKWVPAAETVDLIVAFKRPVYERVVAAFASLLDAGG